jgi:hypothetical protein
MTLWTNGFKILEDDIGQQWFQGEHKVQIKLNEFKVQGLITYMDENFNHPPKLLKIENSLPNP